MKSLSQADSLDPAAEMTMGPGAPEASAFFVKSYPNFPKAVQTAGGVVPKSPGP